MTRKFALLLVIGIIIVTPSSALAGYKSKLNKYTERGRIYSLNNFDATLIWHATFFSDQFREAFEEKHIKTHHMYDPTQISHFRAEQEYEQQKEWQFFVGFYTQQDFKQFSSESDSFWKAHLTTGSGEILEPTSVEMIPVSPYERVMFPYLNRWSKAYRISFPKVDLGDKFTLTVRSVAGQSTLKWNVK